MLELEEIAVERRLQEESQQYGRAQPAGLERLEFLNTSNKTLT